MATIETFIKAARIKPDGYLPGGLPFVRASTLERLEKQTEQEPVRKGAPAAPDFMKVVEHAIMTAKTPDEAHTIAFRAEQVIKARVRDDADPADKARNEKLAWIDTERKRLEKLGGRTTTEAINEAMANWAAQGNSPGSR